MATREEIEWVCDLCTRVRDVETHTVTMDGEAVEVDACEPCWRRPADVLDKLLASGRRLNGGRRKRRK